MLRDGYMHDTLKGFRYAFHFAILQGKFRGLDDPALDISITDNKVVIVWP